MPRLQSTANAFHEVLELRGMSATHLVNPPTDVHHVNCSAAPTKVYAPGTLQATFPAPASTHLDFDQLVMDQTLTMQETCVDVFCFPVG